MGASVTSNVISSCSKILSELNARLHNKSINKQTIKSALEVKNKNDIIIENVSNSTINAIISQKISTSVAYNFLILFNDITDVKNKSGAEVTQLSSVVSDIIEKNLSSLLDGLFKIEGVRNDITATSDFKMKADTEVISEKITDIVIDSAINIEGSNNVLIRNVDSSTIDLNAQQEIGQEFITRLQSEISQELSSEMETTVVAKQESDTKGNIINNSITWIIVAIIAAVIVIVVIIIAPIIKDAVNKKATTGSTAPIVEKRSADSTESTVDKQSN